MGHPGQQKHSHNFAERLIRRQMRVGPAVINIMRKIMKFIALCACFFIHCNSPTAQNREPKASFPDLRQHLTLTQLATYAMDLREPSGLTIDPEGTTLWTVGNNQRVFKLDLQGRILDRLAYKGNDLEGIVYDPTDSTIWVVEERRREVVQLDVDGNLIFSQKLALGGEDNNGLEGICRDSFGTLYVVNEKSPGLFLELNSDAAIKKRLALHFADDYSGLFCGIRQDEFWLLSDQDEALIRWDRQNGDTQTYKLPFSNAEGITVDPETKKIYIVNDEKAHLYVFEFSVSTP